MRCRSATGYCVWCWDLWVYILLGFCRKMRAYSGCVSSDIHLQQSHTPADTSWLLIEWVTEGSVRYPYSQADSDSSGEQTKVAGISLQNSTDSFCLTFKVLGHAGRQTRGLHGSFLVFRFFSWSSWSWLCCREWKAVLHQAGCLGLCQLCLIPIVSLLFPVVWDGVSSTGKNSAGLIDFFHPLGGEDCCFPFLVFF